MSKYDFLAIAVFLVLVIMVIIKVVFDSACRDMGINQNYQ